MMIRVRKNKLSLGFTLVELLVVISIVSLSSSVVFAMLDSAREKSRDAKRALDSHQFVVALDSYFAYYGFYPCSEVSCDGSVSPFISESNAGTALIAAGFIPKISADPRYSGLNCNGQGGGYCYCSRGSDSFVLTVNTEQDNGGSDRCYDEEGPSASTYCNVHLFPDLGPPVEPCADRF